MIVKSRATGGKSPRSHAFIDADATVCGRLVTSTWSVLDEEQPTCIKCWEKLYLRLCPRGHDTFKVGRAGNNRCLECVREADRRYWRRLHKSIETRVNPEPIPNLLRVRWNLGLTQQQLADYCGIGTSHISRLERGLQAASERIRYMIIAGVKRAQKAEAERIRQRDMRKIERRVS